ncbi:MAG TPA: DUF2877 domain-containing protein [Actinomycetota bacterium]|nr:DUF2877 domain-containing protein [Actinomycetota bacterium]
MAARLELGLGAQQVLSLPGTGRVAGVYSKAAYLKLPAGLTALTTFDVPSGPVHARTAARLAGLQVDDRVVLTASLLQAGPVLLDLAGAAVWRGPVPAPEQLERCRGPAVALLTRAPGSALDPALVGPAGALLERGHLEKVAALLGGVGPGLTPAGDDCLAGILLTASIGCPDQAQRLSEVAASVSTNDISRTFLHWAARGQSIAPVHRFLVTAAAGDLEGAGRALDDLTRFGHSSGADLALGLHLGLRHFQLTGETERRVESTTAGW